MVTDYTVTPSTSNPLGAGAGEAGTISSAAAVMNAVVDALARMACATWTCQPRHSECGERSTTKRTEVQRIRRIRLHGRRLASRDRSTAEHGDEASPSPVATA